MYNNTCSELVNPGPNFHPLKLFDVAESQGRFLYISAPMVRYSKLAFRQTVHRLGTDLTYTPMILAKEFNRSHAARDSDLTLSTSPTSPPTIVQFGANSALELSRAASLVAPWVSGIDLNCGCPQSWAYAENLGAKLMDSRELVYDMLTECRARLRADGWGVGRDQILTSAACSSGNSRTEGPSSTTKPKTNTITETRTMAASDAAAAAATSPAAAVQNAPAQQRPGRSISLKIRVHTDLRHTVDFLDTIVGSPSSCPSSSFNAPLCDWLTIHPRTRYTPSTSPIDLEALRFLAERYGRRVPLVVSGDVFSLHQLPFTSDLRPLPTMWTTDRGVVPRVCLQPGSVADHADEASVGGLPYIPHIKGLMSARALLANPGLYSGEDHCSWRTVELFMQNVARANLPLKLVQHHLTEMLGPGLAPSVVPSITGGDGSGSGEKGANENNTVMKPGGPKPYLVGKRDRVKMLQCGDFCELVDFLDDIRHDAGGLSRI